MQPELSQPISFWQRIATLRWLTRWLVVLTVFAIFPIVVAQVAFRQIDKLEVEKVVQARNTLHEKILAKLKLADDDMMMITRFTRRLARRLGELPPAAACTLLKRAERHFPLHWDLYVFDREGKMIPELSSKRHPRRATERIMEIVRKKDGSTPSTEAEDGMFQSFARIQSRMELGRGGKRWVTLGKRDQDTYFTYDFYNDPKNRVGAMMALCHRGSFQIDRALKNAITLVNRRSRTSKIGFLDIQRTAMQAYPATIRNYSDLRSRMVTALGMYERHFSGEAFIATSMIRSISRFFVAVAPRPHFISPDNWKLIHVICLIWLLFVIIRIPLGSQGFSARIPTKLVTLFLFALGVPFVLLLVGGYYALKDHNNVLMANLENRIREKLMQFDERLPSDLNRLEALIRGNINLSRSYKTQQERSKIYDRVKQEKAVDLFYVVDLRGRVVYANPPLEKETRPEVKKRNEFFILIARELLKRINNSMKVDSGSVMLEVTEGVFNSLLGGTGGGFDLNIITSELGRFFLFTIAEESSYLFFDALYDDSGEAFQILCAQVQRAGFERMYVQNNLQSLIKQPDFPWRLAILGDQSHFGSVFPEPADISKARELSEEVNQKRANARAIIASGPEERLWLGMRGQNISRFTMVANTSVTPVRERIAMLWILLLGIAFMVLLSTSVIGLFLSEQFLAPIGDLTTGIQAIQQRRFDLKIPVHSRDELGEMAQLLNHVLEGMQDLQVARIVQESLFPQHPLELGEYRIYGRSRAMADIGGDYFDYFKLGEKRLMGLVGDVSGHGVSAALIMGMAKCAMTLDENPDKNLLDVITLFNRFLLKTIQRKKMMTLFLYSVDTTSNVFQFTNAGHNGPMRWDSSENTLEYLAAESFPLGVRAKATYELQEFPLDPGDAVVFYTDGLIEATGPDGQQLGYDLALSWVRECTHQDAKGIVDSLFTRFDETTRGSEPNDDISIICLKRLG